MKNMFNNSTENKKPEKSDRKEVILDAFDKMVSQYGMDRTTMQDIANAAGISVGTLYNEYKDKDALIDALVARIEHEMEHKINNMDFTSDSPEQQLNELIVAVSQMVTNLLHDKRSILDYYLTGSRRFRYIGMKIKHKSDAENIVNSRVKEIIARGVEQGVFQVKDIDEATRVISYAHITFIAAQIFLGTNEDEMSNRLREYAIHLIVKGLRKES